MGKGWSLLSKDSCWILGKGEDIEFWHDNWLGIGNIRALVEGPLNENESGMNVKAVVGEDGNWDLDRLSLNLPGEIISRIKSINPPSELDEEDILAPTYLTHQGFSLSLAYQSQIPCENRIDVGWVWSIKTLPRIQFFIWLACLDRLPHRKLLVDRRVPTQVECPRCNQGVEDTNHILRSCPLSHEVWDLTPIQGLQKPVSVWIQENVKEVEIFRNIEWRILFPFLCFEIWKSRNHSIFNPNKPKLKAEEILAHAWRNAKTYVLAHNSSESNHDPVLVRLTDQIPRDWAMINVDAAFKDVHHISGLGGVLRDSEGKWILGFTKSIYARDALDAELKGIQEGLATALNHGIQKLVLFSDCKTAITLLDHETPQSNIYANVLRVCRDLRKSFEQIRITHCSRDLNKVADLLARNCRRQEDPRGCNNIATILTGPPSYCTKTYLAERSSSP